MVAVVPAEYQQALEELAAEDDGIDEDVPLDNNADIVEPISGLVVTPKEKTWKMDGHFICRVCVSFTSLTCMGSNFAENIQAKSESFQSYKLVEKFVLPRLASFCQKHGIVRCSAIHTVQCQSSCYMVWFSQRRRQDSLVAMIHYLTTVLCLMLKQHFKLINSHLSPVCTCLLTKRGVM